MPGFIKQTFIVLVPMLLYFGGSLPIKCKSKNKQPRIVRPLIIDLNLEELH